MKNTIISLLLAAAASVFSSAGVFAQFGGILQVPRPRPAQLYQPQEQPQAKTAIDGGQKEEKDKKAEKDKKEETVYAYAVLIGINQYSKPESEDELEFPSLNCCVNDMTKLRDALIKAKFAEKENIILLTDEKATAENIQRVLENVNAKAKSGDIVLVAFSGHGIALPVTRNGVTTFQSFLCPSDTKIVYDADKKEWNTGGKLIPIRELFSASADKDEVFKIAILDACRNVAPKIDGATVKSASFAVPVPEGGTLVARKSAVFHGKSVIDSAAGRNNNAAGGTASFDDVAFAEEDLMQFDNLVRLSSCRKGQQSLEDKTVNHGIFTKFVLEALEGKADTPVVTEKNGRPSVKDGDGVINFFELTDYVTTKVQDFVKKQYGDDVSQKPSLSVSETTTAVIVGYSGEKGQTVDFNRSSNIDPNQSAGRLRMAGMTAQQKVDRALKIWNAVNRIPVAIPRPAIPNIPGLGG